MITVLLIVVGILMLPLVMYFVVRGIAKAWHFGRLQALEAFLRVRKNR